MRRNRLSYHLCDDQTGKGGFWVWWIVTDGGPELHILNESAQHFATPQEFEADFKARLAEMYPPVAPSLWPLHIRDDAEKLNRAKVCESCEHMKKQPTCAACNYCEKLPGEPNKHRLYDAIARGVCPEGKFVELTHASHL